MVEFRARGKEFNEISRDTEQKLQEWLAASGLNLEGLKEYLEKENVEILVDENEQNISIKLAFQGSLIGLPFLYTKGCGDGGEEEKMFYMDFVLLILAAISVCNEEIYKKIKEQLNVKILPRI